MDILISRNIKICLTEHEQKQGIVFPYKQLSDSPWFSKTFKLEVDGVRVFSLMRTRQLESSTESSAGAFLSFNFLKESSTIKVKDYIETEMNASRESDDMDTSNLVLQPREIVANFAQLEFEERERQKSKRFQIAEEYTRDMVKISDSDPQ